MNSSALVTPRRRVKVSHKLRCPLGKAFTLPHDESMESLLSRLQHDIFSKLPPILRLRTEDLAEIIDIGFIRDGDQLVIECDGDRLYEEWITLNVGGTLMTTTRSSLTKTSPECVLARMFVEQNNSLAPSLRDKNNAYLLDRTPRYFEPLLHYLRTGSLVLDPEVNPLGVYEEAKYFGVKEIISELESRVEESLCRDTAPLTRREVVDAIISTSNVDKLRFQGVNLSGADLSKLDLSNINFKHANLSNCQMMGTNLSRCNLERANLSNTVMDNAQLVAVKMACADLEGASIRGGKFEDPEGTAANMEGANLKNTDFENSNMAGINLRVATLKNANLKNCDLRGATLAGANLELCDLSGSDLHNANLRGANLKDASLKLMLTPLHMSQTV